MSGGLNQTTLILKYCDASNINSYVANLTSFTGTSNEPTMVSASVIIFVLAVLFFNLNLFSGISNVSAILDPRVRLLLSNALSLFLPVMSYLFSEAKNNAGTALGSSVSGQAGLILTWMLLVELLRKKVDEIPMRGYSGTLQRAGRVVWLGSLVFFNIRSSGQKALFSILWVLCATKLVQRIAFTEFGKRSYTCGKNARLITSYTSKILEQDQQQQEEQNHQDDGDAMLKRCKYVVMGEEGLIIEATGSGYKLKDASSLNTVVTVGKIWELDDRVFTDIDQDQRLRRLCLSFALFKLLRRRFEHLPEMSEAETRESRGLILNGLYADREEYTAALVFQMMNSEVNFLSEYYHSVVPVVLASPFFFLTNYFLFPMLVFGICLMTIILCGSGNVRYAFRSIKTDNFSISSDLAKITMCLLTRIFNSPAAFFTILDFAITFLLYIIFFYEEIWEFFVFLLSNWFMVSLLCNYVAKPRWRDSPKFSVVVRCIMCVRSKMRHTVLSFKQFSVLNLRWPLGLPLPATLSLLLRTKPVPNKVKHSIMESLVAHCHRAAHNVIVPLTNGKSALAAAGRADLSWACETDSDSVAEVILAWHIATSVLEVECPPKSESKDSSSVAKGLSKYCAYLAAFHPELLPDHLDKAERVFEDMKAELKGTLRCCNYYFSSQRSRVKMIMEATEDGNGKGVVYNGAKLGKLLKEEANKGASNLEMTWKLLAEVWTELVIYVAPSSEEERVMAHENVLVQGGEFITVLWALTTHTGVTRPAKNSTWGEGDSP